MNEETLLFFIKSTLKNEKHLGDNLKKQCIDYVESLQQLKDNWNKLREWLKEYEEGSYGLGSYETGLSDGLGDVIKKMQELEQGSASNE